MPPRPSPRLSITILLTILAGLFAALAGILGNIAASSIPSAMVPYLRFAWPALGIVVLLGISISVWQVRREVVVPTPSPIAQQAGTSPASVPQTSASSGSTSIPAQPANVPPAPAPTPIQQQSLSVDYHTCVLSYATEDQAFAEKLHTDLQSKGISCWFAPHELKIGDRLRIQIYEAIQKNDKLLLILSEHAVKSDWVEREVELAFERERQPPETLVLFPIRLDDAVMQTNTAWAGDIRRIRFIGDFRQWQNDVAYRQALQRLLRDLQR